MKSICMKSLCIIYQLQTENAIGALMNNQSKTQWIHVSYKTIIVTYFNERSYIITNSLKKVTDITVIN